jgi:hypothetical protein
MLVETIQPAVFPIILKSDSISGKWLDLKKSEPLMKWKINRSFVSDTKLDDGTFALVAKISVIIGTAPFGNFHPFAHVHASRGEPEDSHLDLSDCWHADCGRNPRHEVGQNRVSHQTGKCYG